MPTNPIPAVPARYYPRLSEIITVDDLPEFLSFVQGGLNAIFDNIHYKNLQYSKGYRGDSAFYSLDIVTSKRLELPLPYDLALVLNPDITGGDSSISSFPITLEYQWEILAFLKTFSSASFSFSLEDFYKVGLDVFRISEEQVIAHMLNVFVEPAGTITKFEQLLADINSLDELANDPAFQELGFTGAEQSIEIVTDLIKNNNQIKKSIPLLLFAVYILKSDIDETKKHLQEFYNIIAPDGIEAHIKRIITPKAKATLALSAGIEFPHSILRPVESDGSDYKDPITHVAKPEAKSMFVFAKAQLYADTEAGIGYQLEMGGSLAPSTYAMIGKTGLILQLDTLKVDLSKKTNIPEADADDRPNDFVGVYARAISVTLPSKWFHSDDEDEGNTTSTLRVGASDLLVGTGGLSGTIYLETVPVVTEGNASSFHYFDDKFDFIYPITMFEKNNDTSVSEEKSIADYSELLAHLQVLNTAGVPYAFKFPLALLTKPNVNVDSAGVNPSTVYTFNTAQEYQNFLSKLIDNTLWKKIGSGENAFRIGFKKFDITFKQNKVVGSGIKGALEIPKFKKEGDQPLLIDLEGHLYEDGDFNLTASLSQPLKANLFNIVAFDFKSFELGKDDDDYYIGTSCEVSFPSGLMDRLTKGQPIILDKLRIYSDGSISLADGGAVTLPINISLNLGPVKMGVSNITFGSSQLMKDGIMRKYNFWGFDGAISINPLGLDARGEGVKFYYTVDDDPESGKGHDNFLHIRTIEVDLMIPGTATEASAMVILHGMVTLPDPGASPEFIGAIDLTLPKAKISGGVALRLMPKYPAFLIDAHLELPTPIPLGFIAITAFRGLLGFRYVATKKAAGLTDDASWYEFYKKPKQGINIMKFSGPPDSLEHKLPFSIGVGATFVTSADGGFIFSLRAMLMLSLPTLFSLDAGLNIIAGKLGLIEDDPSNPPFFAMAAIGDDSLELAAGADFSIPKDSGEIFSLHALLAAGFYFKNQKPWYVNLGSKNDPIVARILTIITAKSFIMLSAQGIEAGARLDFNLERSFGPARVRLWAYLEMGGKISFKRPQMGGYITAGGGIYIKIWIASIEITLDVIFSVESFKPFLIYASLRIYVSIRIFRKRIGKHFTVEIQWDIRRVIDKAPYSPLPKGIDGDKGDNRTSELVKGIHMLTNEGFALNYSAGVPSPGNINKVIPLDTYIDIKMAKGLYPKPEVVNKIGGYTSGPMNYTEVQPPLKESTPGGRKLRQVSHEYSIKSLELKSWNGSGWVDYHPFEAVVKADERAGVNNLPWAYWQKAIDQYDSIRVLATNPFSFLGAGQPGWHVPEQYGITPSKLFCVSDKLKKEHTDFLNKYIGKRYYIPTQYEADKINGLYFKLLGEIPELIDGKLVGGDFMNITGRRNPLNYRRSLSFKNYNELEIIFPESAIEPSLNLTTDAKEVKIKAYTAVTEDNAKFVKYELVSLKKAKTDTSAATELTYTKNEVLSGITLYDEENDPFLKTSIDKIVITPVGANAERINEIRNEIAVLFDNIYANEEEADVETAMDTLINSSHYIALTEELKELLREAGNEKVDVEGAPEQLTFTRYYGYQGSETYTFDRIFKYNDTYLMTFHPQANTTAIVQIDATGQLIRERLVNAVVTSMQVVNDNLVLTQALDANQCKGISIGVIDDNFVVGCNGSQPTTAIIELDSELNQVFGIQYPDTYSLAYNKLFPLADNEILWVNTLADETQINWLGANRSIHTRVSIDDVAIKVVQHNATQFSLITKDKKIIQLTIDAVTETINVTDAHVISDTTIAAITDAVIANNKIVIGVKLTNGKFGLAQIDGTAFTVVKNDTIFETPVFLSNKVLADNSIIAYNQKHLFLFNNALALTRLIERDNEVAGASIIDIQNEPSANEILMLSNIANEKGAYFSLFNDEFDNCSLHSVTTPTVTASSSTLTSSTADITDLSATTTLEYRRRIRYSNLIRVNDLICSSGGDSQEDEELDYTTNIQRVCWLTAENYLYNMRIPGSAAVEADKAAMVAGIQNTVQPIWRPNTTYYLHFTLEDSVSTSGKKSQSTPNTFEYYYGFKTEGPLGHYTIPPPKTKVLADMVNLPVNGLANLSKSPLASLRQYIDYRRSYPNADGSLLQAKPVYYGAEQCTVSLYFTNPYVYHMFKDWEDYGGGRPRIEGALNLWIKDPLNDVKIPYPLPTESVEYPTPIVEEDKGWKDDNDPRIPVGIQLLNNFIKEINAEQGSAEFPTLEHPIVRCQLNMGDALTPKSYAYSVKLTNLKPLKLYTLLVNNYFDKNQNGAHEEAENALVHQFGFQTSRYENFEQHVNSFVLEEKNEAGAVIDSQQALFEINVDLDEERIEALYYLVSAATTPPNSLVDSLALNYHDAFDRAIEGVLQLSPLDPAQGTEINKIRNSTGEVIAILIRNPEPFNIPKIPLEEIQNTITVDSSYVEGEAPFTQNPDYKVLHSKDYAQVLIMNTSKNISVWDLSFRFEYRMWNNEGIMVDGIKPLTLPVDNGVVVLKNINI